MAERKDIQDVLDYWREQGITVYSVSRINNFNNCEYGYHLTYNKRIKGSQNIYSEMGGIMHDCLQNIMDGVATVDDMKKEFYDSLTKCEVLGIHFPSESIKKSWIDDMTNFVNSFKPLEGDFMTEKGIVFDVDGVKMQGYIDVISINKKAKTVDVIDWKTSSKFTGEKLLHSGRQLILYALALQQICGVKVDKVAWYMLKYISVLYDKRSKMCNRSKWVKEISGLIMTQMKKLGYEPFIAQMLIDDAVAKNSLDGLPVEVQKRFTTEDCVIYYDITPELVEETKKYVKDSVDTIISKNKENDDEWKPVEINRKTEFFCSALCGYGGENPICQFYKQYKN